MKILALTVSYLNEEKLKSKWIDLFYSSLSSHSESIQKYDHLIVLNDENPKRARQNISERKGKYDFEEYSLHFKENDGTSHSSGIKQGIIELKRVYDFSEYDFVTLHEFDVVFSVDFTKTIENLCPILKENSTVIGETGVFSFWNKKLQPERLQPSFFLFHSKFFGRLLTLVQNNIDSQDFDDFGELRNLTEKECVEYDLNIDVGSGLYRSLFFRQCNILNFHGDNVFNHVKGISFWFDRIINGYNEDVALKKLRQKFDYVKRKYEHLDFSSDSVFNKEKEEVFSEIEKAYLLN